MNTAPDETTRLIDNGDSHAAYPDTVTGDSLSFKDACRDYRAAILWSIFFSLGTITISFDNQVINNLLATPTFRRTFGYKYGNDYVVPAAWQTGIYMGASLGQVITPMLITLPLEYFGRKRIFAFCTLATTAFVYMQFVASTPTILLISELLGGMVLAAFALLGPLYSAEVCPLALRGIVTAYTQLCWVLGQLLANIVTKAFSEREDAWAYRGPFALQFLLPVIIILVIPFAPESPWYLVAKGQMEQAESALRKLSSPRIDSKAELARIFETHKAEQKAETGTSYWDCFRSVNRRRTEIAVGVYSSQVLSGIYMIGYGTYFFELAGLPTRRAFEMGVAFLAVGVLGSFLAWVLILKLGRRTVEVSGLGVLALLQLLIGLLDLSSNYTSKIAWAQSSLLLAWNLGYNLTIGPFCFIIICECSSVRLRSKTIAMATACQAAIGIGMNFLVPYLMNPDQLNLRGRFGFVFAVLGAACFLWAYFRVPETKDRTFEELDVMFEMRVPTREFKSFKVPDWVSS